MNANREAMQPNETIVEVNGVDLFMETFGDPTKPSVLLIMGVAASMLWWEEEFCERLAQGPRFVIRYDQRDTGRSVSYAPGAPGYTTNDLVADAVGLLDVLGLASAHLVGMSMGGMIAQLAALDHPERVASLTLLSTSPGERATGDATPSQPQQESPADEVGPDWSDRAAAIDAMVADARAVAARSRQFDEAAMRDLVTRDVDRTVSMASSMTNHFVALSTVEPWRERLATLAVPTLVMHGTEDPVFPYDDAVALAGEIPGARLIALDATGHELPRAIWDRVATSILRHTDSR